MHEVLRVTVHLNHDDNPALYRALARVPKGHRRTGRLVTLAVLGLHTEAPPEPAARGGAETSFERSGAHSSSSAADELFSPISDGRPG